ncbi:capsule assembly Wzi family protein [uncultured Fibrella sp.]|uniref:capsule assembly Wzi family protein n=1 Tax=uncultured Fibrella sp. TaxID=1284596 RepID=UPI0035C98D49
MRFYLYTISFILIVSHTKGQTADTLALKSRIRGVVEIGGMTSSVAQTPFWLRTNQYGIVSLGGSAGTLRASAFRDYRPVSPTADSVARKGHSRFDWGLGLSVVGNTGPVDLTNNDLTDARQVLWPEVFAKIRFGQFELFGGRRREVYGLGDTTLTSGFVAWSGNAIPFPKIQLHTPNFVPIRWLRNAVAFRVGYAHGWFTQPNIQGAMLHQKYVYLRFGKPTAKLAFTTGLNHQVQWGGRADYLRNTIFSVDGQLPDTFKDYVAVVLAKYPDAFANDRFTEFDGTNRVGNHVGSIDFALEWKDARRSWQLYHQHIYEDASGIAFQNVPDGLTGLRWLNRKVDRAGTFRLTRVVVEVLTTTDQSGDTFDFKRRFQGRDNYFNHGQYVQGWSYQGRTIGTPFIAPRTTFTQVVNANEGGGFFPNNRLVMWYAGAQAQVKTVYLTARVAWSRNFGSYDQAFPVVYQQTSAMLAGQGRLPRLPNVWLTASLALDRGELYPDTVGGFLSLQKRW